MVNAALIPKLLTNVETLRTFHCRIWQNYLATNKAGILSHWSISWGVMQHFVFRYHPWVCEPSTFECNAQNIQPVTSPLIIKSLLYYPSSRSSRIPNLSTEIYIHLHFTYLPNRNTRNVCVPTSIAVKLENGVAVGT